VFFAFHYADILRVNNVRLSGEFTKSASNSGRDVEGFYDNSLWESRKRSGDDAIRNLIRDGVKNSSAVCVLIGSGTWSRPWVRYEIARAVIDGRGILAVHVNGPALGPAALEPTRSWTSSCHRCPSVVHKTDIDRRALMSVIGM